jgi:hypothetical protein
MRFPLHWNKRHWWLIALLLGLSGTITALVGALFLWGPPMMPLWYSLIVAADELATKQWLWVPIAVTWGMSLLTLWFSRSTALEHEDYIAVLSLYSGVVSQLLLLLAIGRLVFLFIL